MNESRGRKRPLKKVKFTKNNSNNSKKDTPRKITDFTSSFPPPSTCSTPLYIAPHSIKGSAKRSKGFECLLEKPLGFVWNKD